MNITFIVGNEFDLNLDMNTNYLDFLNSKDTERVLANNLIYKI